MKIIIVSDTHGLKKNMQKLVPMIKENIDLIIHAGDHFRDSVYLSNETGIPVMSVVGNCDFDNVEDEVIFDIQDIKILLVHGHRHRVKYGVEFLAEYAESKGANIAIFGHTHVKTNEVVRGVQLINPGSLSQPRDGLDGSYVIMEIKNGNYSFEFFRHEVDYRSMF